MSPCKAWASRSAQTGSLALWPRIMTARESSSFSCPSRLQLCITYTAQTSQHFAHMIVQHPCDAPAGVLRKYADCSGTPARSVNTCSLASTPGLRSPRCDHFAALASNAPRVCGRPAVVLVRALLLLRDDCARRSAALSSIPRLSWRPAVAADAAEDLLRSIA